MPPDSPNVLFVMSDEHTFRGLGHLEPEGRGEPVSTPTLDDLAAAGATFDQAYCQVPLCTPSRICLLTGREQRNCSAWGNRAVLPPDLPTLPGVLSDAGYETCLVGKMHLGGSRQFAGFDHRPYGDLTGRAGHQPDPLPFDVGRDTAPKDWATAGNPRDTRLDDPGVTEIPESLLQEEQVADETVSFIREQEAADPDQPWFVCASFGRPHDPWTAPRRYIERYWDVDADEPTDRVTAPKVGYEGDTTDHPLTRAVVENLRSKGQFTGDIDEMTVLRTRAAYFACIEYLDDVLGDMFARLDRSGALDNTIVVYTSDHGELGGEHGLWYKRTWHEASTRVPLLFQTPAHRAGDRSAARLETPVGLGDLFPTICGLTGVDAPGGLDGVDLSASVRDGTEPERGPVFCDNLGVVFGDGIEWRLVRSGRYKYVAFSDAPELLFDLEADPLEQDNLAPDASGEAAEALDRLRSLAAETMDFDAAIAEREASTLREEYPLDVRKGLGEDSFDGRKGEITNTYHMPDGRVVDADTILYNPIVVTETAEEDYDDYPED